MHRRRRQKSAAGRPSGVDTMTKAEAEALSKDVARALTHACRTFNYPTGY